MDNLLVGEDARTISLLLVTKSSLIQHALEAALNQGAFLCHSARSLDMIPRGFHPEIVLLEYSTSPSEFEIMRAVEAFPGSTKVALVNFDNFDDLILFYHHGITAVLSARWEMSTIESCLRYAASGQAVVAASFLREAATRLYDKKNSATDIDLLNSMSEKEIETLRLIGHGASNKEIALREKISVATAKARISGLMRKVGAKNRAQLAIWSVEHGLALSAEE